MSALRATTQPLVGVAIRRVFHDTSLASVRAFPATGNGAWPAGRRLALGAGLMGWLACGGGTELASESPPPSGPRVASVEITPNPATVVKDSTLQLVATPRDAAGNALSGRVVSWSTADAGVATVDNAGLVSGVAAGNATITATSEGRSGTSALTVVTPRLFPTEYSLTRPLLVNNPGALVTGEDWQDMQADQDIYDLNFFRYPDGTDPALTRQVILETADPTFGTVVKAFQTDAATILPGGTVAAKATVEGKRGFSGIDKAWYRFTMKFQSGFTLQGPGGGANAWKFMFGGVQWHYEWVFSGGKYDDFSPPYGGTEVLLPNSEADHGNSNPAFGNTERTDEEWWEFIVYEERLSSSHYRVRRWRRELTANGAITGLPSSATWDKLFGWETTGATIPAGDSDKIQLGINRNKVMFAGQSQYWFWGPWEVIDASVLPDPYGIEDQIR